VIEHLPSEAQTKKKTMAQKQRQDRVEKMDSMI